MRKVEVDYQIDPDHIQVNINPCYFWQTDYFNEDHVRQSVRKHLEDFCRYISVSFIDGNSGVMVFVQSDNRFYPSSKLEQSVSELLRGLSRSDVIIEDMDFDDVSQVDDDNTLYLQDLGVN